MTLVEEVARAICKAGNENPDHISAYQKTNNPLWMTYIPQASAAIMVIEKSVTRNTNLSLGDIHNQSE